MPQSKQARMEEVRTEFIEIPATKLRVSRVALGTWAMGGWMWGGTDERESIATIRAALNQGINLIDTAPVYGFGVAEEIVGKALDTARLRERAIISTKVGVEWRNGTVYRNATGAQRRKSHEAPQARRGATRGRIMQEIDDSLRRLNTDHIDIYHVHWPDPLVPIEETAETMYELYERGKIGAIGVSNFSVEQMERFRKVAPLHVLQPPYNLFERDIEGGILPYCRANNIATLGYGALCRGLLSGRMRADTTFAGDDLRQLDPKFQPPRFAQYRAAVQRLDQLAHDRFRHQVIHLAVRWMLDQGVSVALWGARRPEQLEAALRVAGWTLDADTRARIDRILSETITDPVGPEFMAPAQRRS